MAIDISLEGLDINENGFASDVANGILTITWAYPRPNMANPNLLWPISIGEITDKKDRPDTLQVDMSGNKWFEKIAFRQDAIGKSFLIVELATSKDIGMMGKIAKALLSLGSMTLGGMIPNVIAKSIFDTVAGQIDIPEKTVRKIGVGIYELDSSRLPSSPIEIALIVPKDIEISPQVKPSPLQPGAAPPKGQPPLKAGSINGKVILSIKEMQS